MGSSQTRQDIERLLADFPDEIAELARRAVGLVAALGPDMEQAVRFGWQSVGFRHPAAGYVCGVFPRHERVLLLFEHGRLLADPRGLLEGDGRQVRYIPLLPGRPLPARSAVADLLAEAIALRAGPRTGRRR